MKKNSLGIKRIALVSLLLAIAFAIDFITGIIPGLNLSMPLGGRLINLSLIPIMLIGIFVGPVYGITGGVIYGVFGYFFDGYALSYFADNLIEAMIIFLLDYIIAFGVLGLTGLFRNPFKKPLNFMIASILTLGLKWLSATIVGAILWSSFASSNDWTNSLFEGVGSNAFIYSGIYNLVYTITTFIAINIIVFLSHKQLNLIKEQFSV